MDTLWARAGDAGFVFFPHQHRVLALGRGEMHNPGPSLPALHQAGTASATPAVPWEAVPAGGAQQQAEKPDQAETPGSAGPAVTAQLREP